MSLVGLFPWVGGGKGSGMQFRGDKFGWHMDGRVWEPGELLPAGSCVTARPCGLPFCILYFPQIPVLS